MRLSNAAAMLFLVLSIAAHPIVHGFEQVAARHAHNLFDEMHWARVASDGQISEPRQHEKSTWRVWI
jgi:ABC-type thiamine transport system substrate-binding protein